MYNVKIEVRITDKKEKTDVEHDVYFLSESLELEKLSFKNAMTLMEDIHRFVEIARKCNAKPVSQKDSSGSTENSEAPLHTGAETVTS